ncbi:MAG: hypothetical protein GF355_05340, partial [Candidatus Eisenbacteria bacterium]|nr:hypothetical protein [Candidatus Eisenbacteria bacterium]
MLENEFPETFGWVDCHIIDDYETWGTDGRSIWYNVGGLPHVRLDGTRTILGATSCYNAYLAYRNAYLERMSETGGTSPVEIRDAYLV